MAKKRKHHEPKPRHEEPMPGITRNPVLGAVDTFIDRSREIVDPIKKVCYPVIETAKKPIEYLSDPVKKICYEPFVMHYEERYKKRYPKHAGKLYVLDMFLLAVIGTLVVAGMFAYFVAPVFPEQALVALEPELPSTLVSGARDRFAVAYVNGSDSTIPCANIVIEPPADLQIYDIEETAAAWTEGCPETPMVRTENRIALRLGELAPGARGRVTLDGALFAPTGETRTLRAELRYWKRAATEATRVPLISEMRVDHAVTTLGVSMPETVIRGQVIPVTLTYHNDSDEALAGLTVRLTAPEDFVITGSTPYRTGPADWRIGDLEPGTGGTITAWGYLRSAFHLAHPAVFTVRAYVEQDGSRLLVESARTNADPLASGFELSQRIVSPAGRRYVGPGDTVSIAVTYGNTGTEPLRDMRIRLYGDTRFLTPSEAGMVTWNAENTPELAEVAPGDTGTLTATFAVRETIGPSDLISGTVPTITFATEAEAQAGTPARTVLADTPPDALNLGTRLSIAALPVYYTSEGDQLGRGTLPMTPGENTRFWVFLDVANSLNAVQGAVLEANLPDGVEWTGRYSVSSGEALDYLPLTRSVRWSIGDVARFSAEGTTSAQFELSLTPDLEMVGSMPVVLRNIRIQGTDTGTEVLLHATAPDLTTDGLRDRDSNDAGTVVE